VRIDLNADVGEWTGDDPARQTDAALMTLVTTVSIACGAHAGDADSMAATVELAARESLAIGAHPGYPDREGFGRRRLDLSTSQLRATIIDQVARLADACLARGVRLGHVKPHGALYHAAAADAALARVVAQAVRDVDRGLALFGPPGSALLVAASDAGLRPVPEGFADRAYEVDGRLRARTLPGAVHHDPSVVAEQAVAIATRHGVTVAGGGRIDVAAETICLHGDSPDVVDGARMVRDALASAGVLVRRFDRP
jgi:UPF0271 protein